jgi:peptide-methionine (S)-S-oxide reductase
MPLQKIGFGGGCHWCTEAYFQSLRGVEKVEQGWIASNPPNEAFSEAVIVHYDPQIIPLKILIAIHLHTHAATKRHHFREKYRSAVYVFDGNIQEAETMIQEHQSDFAEPLITQVLPFAAFKENTETYQNYFQKNSEGAFCKTYILPKLKMMEAEYATYFSPE